MKYRITQKQSPGGNVYYETHYKWFGFWRNVKSLVICGSLEKAHERLKNHIKEQYLKDNTFRIRHTDKTKYCEVNQYFPEKRYKKGKWEEFQEVKKGTINTDFSYMATVWYRSHNEAESHIETHIKDTLQNLWYCSVELPPTKFELRPVKTEIIPYTPNI